jgi:hypothetical protein
MLKQQYHRLHTIPAAVQTLEPSFKFAKILVHSKAQISKLENLLSIVAKIDNEEWLLLAKQEGGE